MVVKRLFGSHFGQNLSEGMATRLLSTVKNGDNDVRALGFSGDEFRNVGKPALYKLKLRRVAKRSARFLLA